jgi:predicted RNA-binding Zn ribbon-like protein
MLKPVNLLASASADQPLFVDFVNTRHAYEGVTYESIGTEGELSEWLAEHDLPAPYPAGRVPALLELRECGRRIAEALAAGKAISGADSTSLNRALGEAMGRIVLITAETGSSHLAFESDDANGDPVTFRVALSIARFLEHGEHHRLKVCDNPGCDFLFLDTSRNNTRRWCFMRYCGNRMKAREFRRRQQNRTASAADRE